ncbi:MAG: hypothetical protein L3J52_01115, partial [Proteobacteria bacterium]|nr:hypothetical protein [Pseudomonadota bacterium]
MKKYLIMAFLTLPIGVFAINLADLEVDPRTKQQIADGFALKQSIDQYIEQNQSSTPVVTVGGDNACDYRIGTTKIQDAINAHTNVEIRIAQNDVYNENLVINDNNVSLRGGYANCTDAANNVYPSSVGVDPWTSVNGITGSGNPVIKILGNTQRNTIVLDRLLLTRGEGTTENFPGGGISIYQADTQINLNRVYIANNSSLRGGGIAIIEGDTDIIATDLTLAVNTAGTGGGFYCDGSDISLTVLSGVIQSNSANSDAPLDAGGGGVSITNGCSFIMYSGYIYLNYAFLLGGGIDVLNGSIATLFGHEVCSLSGACFGNDTEPVGLMNNSARIAGGGANSYNTGTNISTADTVLNIYAANVIDNKAISGNGGGIHVSNNASFTTARLSKACWDVQKCNYYASNTANDVGVGGAIRCS